MFFTKPIWLWGLIGLVVPIAIHLLIRKEGKTILIGSLRHLSDSPSAQFRHIRINEILLLILRSALLTLIVMLLAGLTISPGETSKKRWVVIDKGIENSKRYRSLLDSLTKNGFDIRLLRDGFPLLKDSTAMQQDLTYWAAAEKLAATNLDSAVMITFGLANQFRGERITKPSSIAWFTDEPPSKGFTAWKTEKGGDSVFTRSGFSSSLVTKFTNTITRKENSKNLPQPKPVYIAIVADKEFVYDQKIITASIHALQTITPHQLILTSHTPEKFAPSHSGWVFWLSAKTLPSENEKHIVVTPCANISTPLVTRAGADNTCLPEVKKGWIISKRLHEDLALKEHLTLRLGEILFPRDDKKIESYDSRVLAEQEMWSDTNNKEVVIVRSETNSNVHAALVIMIIVTFLVERILAFQRNQ